MLFFICVESYGFFCDFEVLVDEYYEVVGVDLCRFDMFCCEILLLFDVIGLVVDVGMIGD